MIGRFYIYYDDKTTYETEIVIDHRLVGRFYIYYDDETTYETGTLSPCSPQLQQPVTIANHNYSN